jgi:hypothetical protein
MTSAARTEVERILNRAARRILAERLTEIPVSDIDPVNDQERLPDALGRKASGDGAHTEV